MVTVVKSNLLTSDCDVIGHQCNCQMKMGSGLALQVRKQFPEVYQAFMADARTSKEKLGHFSSAECDGKLVFNLYGQLHFGGFNCVYTDYHALRSSISAMLAALGIKRILTSSKIGLPFGIGCGLAGGDWSTVEAIIAGQSDKYEKDIYLYKL